jgi:adenylate cyclase
VFTLSFVEAGMPGAYELREGETLIGRAASCDLVINAPTISRQHARVRLEHGRVFVRDAGSTYGTLVNGTPITGEQELNSGDTFMIGHLQFTLTKDVDERDVLSDEHHMFEESHTIVRRVDALSGDAGGPPPGVGSSVATPAGGLPIPTATPSGGLPIPTATPVQPNPTTPAGAVKTGGTAQSAMRAASSAPSVSVASAPAPAPAAAATHPPGPERRTGADRRKVNLGRAAGDRRSGRDRRGGRILRLLTDISKTLVTVQPLEQVLARVVDLVFDALPAERGFLLLRDSWEQPLTARVMRSRDGSVPANVTISRTVVSKVMRDRVAILAKDARYDSRLDASSSIQAMNIRSFMCAPLWNRNDVIGVLYCDNPRSKQFVEEDLDVFAALCNYAAVAIEQARLASQLMEETKRRERLQRYHSPGVVNRILHAEASIEGRFMTQERDVTVMFTDIVGFTKLCEHLEPAAVGEMLNTYFSRMAEIIFEHEGTLDKFIGDAILAVFGAPFDQPDHAERCVQSAIEMRHDLERLNSDREGPPIRMRIAINSGRALTGDIGSPKRKEFTTLGDVVNTASRLEANVAEPDQIVISETTRARLGSGFEVKSLGTFKIRGRQSQVEAFEVIG